MKAFIVALIIIGVFLGWLMLRKPEPDMVAHEPSVPEKVVPAEVEHPIAGCPGCQGEAPHGQPEPIENPVVPSDHVWEPHTVPPHYEEIQPGPPSAPRFN